MKIDPAGFRARLLEWFDAGRRDLPWRRTSDPYRIWISEIMLQQTRVDRAVEYYERFLAAFPTAVDLAAAPLDDVLKQWEGLGYYGRARAAHDAARRIASRFGGSLPETAEDLKTLPGFGPYTSAAVASIAFGEAIAALDTNVFRVLARVRTIDGPVSRAATRARLSAAAAELLDSRRPGDFNQAMMELGAMICRPRSPRCLLCPVSADCAGLAAGDPERWPSVEAKPARPVVHAACALVWRRGKWLVVQRPAKGLLGGLWEFPGARIVESESAGDAAVRGTLAKTGVRIVPGERLTTVRHTFSHFHVVLHAIACRDEGGRLASKQAAWKSPAEIDALALTRTARKILGGLHDVNGAFRPST